MATFNKFDQFVEDIGAKVHDLQAAGDTLKVYLTNATPVATNTVKANIAEISGGNGYTSGGEDVANDYSQTSGTASLTGTDVVWNATGAVGPFQRVVLYNDTPTSPADPLIGWWDYGSAVTLANGESFTVDFGASILTIA